MKERTPFEVGEENIVACIFELADGGVKTFKGTVRSKKRPVQFVQSWNVEGT